MSDGPITRKGRRRKLLERLKRLEDTIRLARSDMAYVRGQIAELDHEPTKLQGYLYDHTVDLRTPFYSDGLKS
jgi:hypothetical protein